MDNKKTLIIILITSLILGLSISHLNNNWEIFIKNSFIILGIVSINILSKKLFAYALEANINIGFWSTYWYGVSKKSHFRKRLYMAWLPLITSILTIGKFIWLPILETEAKARPERISRRHGIYRTTEVSEWHLALIIVAGIVTNILFALTAYILGFETFAKLSIYYATWSILPIGRLDGIKIFFGSRKLWTIMAFILTIVLLWTMSVM